MMFRKEELEDFVRGFLILFREEGIWYVIKSRFVVIRYI